MQRARIRSSFTQSRKAKPALRASPAARAPRERAAVERLHVHLDYSLQASAQGAGALSNPLFELLGALIEGGSIRVAAQLLKVSYRHAWDALKEWERVLGKPLVLWSKGRKAQLSEHARRLVWAERSVRMRLGPQIESLRSQLGHALTEARDARYQLLTISASHDIALSVLQKRMDREAGDLFLDLGTLGSADSLKALNEGRCLVAGFHVPLLQRSASVFRRTLKPLLDPRQHRLIACSRRTQGLILRREHAGRVAALADVGRQGLRFASRQPGSGTRMLIEHLTDAAGLGAQARAGLNDHVEHTHVAVALCVAGGIADVGVGIEAAALQFGLHFVPLVEENYFLACLTPNLDHPAVQRLRRLLSGSAWQGILAGLPGYRPADSPGSVLRPEQVLPWWRRARGRGLTSALS